MRQVLRTYLIMLALLFAICAFTLPSYADTQSVSAAECGACGGTPNGYTLQATLTGPAGGGPGTYSLSFTVTNANTSTSDNSYVNDWSLTMFGPGTGNNTVLSNLTGFTASQDGADYTAVVGKANNGGSCHETITTAVCVSQTSGTPTALGPGQSITFSMSFTCSGDCSELTAWDFLAGGSACDGIGNGNCFSFSANGTPGPPTVPEPSSLALFGSGLMAVGTIVRRKVTRNKKADTQVQG
jgi:PEP-CTERM motif